MPFKRESIFSKLPILRKIYGDENKDVLVEKKFYLDNFFEQITKNNEVYKTQAFIDFLRETK